MAGKQDKKYFFLPISCSLQSLYIHSHLRSSHYAISHEHNKTSIIQGRSTNVVNVIFYTIRNFSKRKEFALSGSKFLPLREVPI